MHCSSALGVPFEDCRIGVAASSIRLQCLHAWVGPTFEMFKIAAHLYEVSKHFYTRTKYFQPTHQDSFKGCSMPGSEEEITWTYTQQQEDTSNATDFNEVMNDLVPAAKCQYICAFQCPILEKDPEAASLDSCYIYT